MTETFYDVLGVSEDASTDEIEDAYREAIKEVHPDVSDELDASERTKRLNKAKRVLADETERERYDRLGHEAYANGGVASAGSPGSSSSSAGERATRGRTGETGTDETGTGTGRQQGGERGSGGPDGGRGRARRSGERRYPGDFGPGSRAQDRRRTWSSSGSAESSGSGSRTSGRGRSASRSADGSDSAHGADATGGSTGGSVGSPGSATRGNGPTAATDPAETGPSTGPNPGSATRGGASRGHGRGGTARTPGPEATGPSRASTGPSWASNGRTAAATAVAGDGGDGATGVDSPSARRQAAAGASDGSTVDWSWNGWESTRSWAVRDGQATYHGLHPSQYIPGEQSFVLVFSAFLLYPFFVITVVYPPFPVIARAAVAVCTVLMFAYLLSVPEIAVLVYGLWSMLVPLAIFLIPGLSIFSLAGVIGLSATWLPLGLSVLTISVVRL